MKNELGMSNEITNNANTIPTQEEDPVLCGILFRHGHEDYSFCTLEMNEEDAAAIMSILEKYANEGCSVRNCFNDRIRDLV